MTDSVASDKARGLSLLRPEKLFRPRPKSELDAAAIKVQKAYRSYQTRRNLADCANAFEELRWKAIDFAARKHSSISLYENAKPETFGSQWTRTRTRVPKVVKALPKDEKAQKLALTHWFEAIDPQHRCGQYLCLYYDVWFKSERTQPFFYWLDVGQGKDIKLKEWSRSVLHRQRIEYRGRILLLSTYSGCLSKLSLSNILSEHASDKPKKEREA